MSPRARWRGLMKGVRVERLDHLGIVAGMCREIGLAEDLDALAGPSRAVGECGDRDGGDAPEWAGVQQPSAVSGLAVLRHQARRALAWLRDHRGAAPRRLLGS